ncbi:3-oxoacyl-ACP synthase III family protein [Pseudosporangium ferrugineum]|uniref:3-oxoacyl-[acyl-carrier-protein] synthase III n=1 Tax=Pseudosporangium ferrugineum TaxID=439699 RepID=A0A2T0SAP5_9ACTN|nr:beta-ketoacyl-ACP synthase 3 [Pseudosporangium ferrugineum]PRY30497.1 3-oxoacyl-[acyl-carrier-protein] synthase III [Pseudosporangium ferrugineum]
MPATIIGTGAALPRQAIANDAFEKLGTSDEWIVRRTGIRQRHWLSGDETLGGLAAGACDAALTDAGVSAADITHVVVATITSDWVTPALAVDVADRLGVPRPAAFDLQAACAGFLYALDHASALIETGRARHVLICGADALSRITDRDDRATAILLGDAAGAVVVSDVPDAPEPSFVLASAGEHRELLYANRADGLLRMQGREVYEHAVDLMVQAAEQLLESRGQDVKDLDLFIAHQANARIIQAVAARLNLPPERVYANVDRVANTSAASIPVALAQARREQTLRPAGLLGMAAFGSGLTWGAGVMSWRLAR